jgi:hypothetical protein
LHWWTWSPGALQGIFLNTILYQEITIQFTIASLKMTHVSFMIKRNNFLFSRWPLILYSPVYNDVYVTDYYECAPLGMEETKLKTCIFITSVTEYPRQLW